MKKLLLGITLFAALFAGNLQAEEVTTDWIWTGAGWSYIGSNEIDPATPPPPPIRE